jgi:hypothetical protein
VDRYRTKPNGEGIRHGRGVDKDTAESRNNVDLTKGLSEDAVRKYRAIDDIQRQERKSTV